MKKKLLVAILGTIFFILFLAILGSIVTRINSFAASSPASVVKTTPSSQEIKPSATVPPTQLPTLSTHPLSVSATPKQIADEKLVKIIVARDWQKLAQYIHPKDGVRLTMLFGSDLKKYSSDLGYLLKRKYVGFIDTDSQLYSFGTNSFMIHTDLKLSEYFAEVSDVVMSKSVTVNYNSSVCSDFDRLSNVYPNSNITEFNVRVEEGQDFCWYRRVLFVRQKYMDVDYLVAIVYHMFMAQ